VYKRTKSATINVADFVRASTWLNGVMLLDIAGFDWQMNNYRIRWDANSLG
jgi:hypothetical protein